MKFLLIKLIKLLPLIVFLVLVCYGLDYVSSDENSMAPTGRYLPNDWGIAKDNPMRFKI